MPPDWTSVADSEMTGCMILDRPTCLASRLWRWALLAWPVGVAWAAGSPAGEAAGERFERRIRPVLVEQCHECHGASLAEPKGGLRLDTRAGLLRGGDSGSAIVPGDPGASLLVRALTHADPDLQMPPRTRLSGEVVEEFRQWIREGAVWPSAGEAPAASSKGFDVARRKAEHWAWAPVARPPVPSVRQESWPRGDLDRFILARWEREGLRPGRDADRRVLIRRAAWVLTGLPPEPEAVEAFVRDQAPGAWERVVDRYLESVHFGERWARHWMDKVRYAETMGHEFDYPIVGAWRYRDYLVRAFNGDVPYPRFAQEHIAGDVLPDRRWSDPRAGGRFDEGRLGAMHYWLLQQVHSPVDVRAQQAETTDNQIDVLTKTFLGLTVACARCHDHKFDAVSTRDYYALYGILSSSRYALRAVDDPAPRLVQAGQARTIRESLRRALADELAARLNQGRPEVPTPGGDVSWRAEDRPIPASDWFPDGEAFAADGAEAGQPVWLGGKGAPARVVLPGWRHGASLARRFQGALRTPTFTLDSGFLHIRLAGAGARFSLVIEGFTLIQAPIYGALRQAVRSEEPHWVTLDVGMWQGRRAWLEFADLGEPDPAAPMARETRSPDGWVAAGEVALSSLREPPSLRPASAPRDPVEVVRRWGRDAGAVSRDEAAWIDAWLRVLPPDASLGAAWLALEAGIAPPVLASSMTEGTGVEEPVFVRGNPRRTGAVVERRFLEALGAPGGTGSAAFREGSGRLALARAVTDPGNPLFHRVMVNWVWSHVFGRGLAGAVDNLGVLGEAPTHPELLDWLADGFRADGGSVKRLIRTLLLSRTWCQASEAVDDDAEQRDPENRLWHRASLRRLEGEAIRDAMLAISGRLDPTPGGPSVRMHLTPFLEGRGRPDSSGPMDGDGRRSLYLEVRRNFLSPFLLAFDLPVPATTVGRRTVSNVPAQALAMMNDPFVLEQARRWGRRVVDGPYRGDAERLRAMYASAFGRFPDEAEAEAGMRYVAERVARGADAAGAWGDLGHALFNTKEFLFLP